MILLAGIASEGPVALASESAYKLGIESLMLNQRSFSHDDMEFDYVSGKCSGSLTVAGRSFDLALFTGIYLRIVDAASMPELARDRWGHGNELEQSRAHAWSDMLAQWTEVASQRVVNRLSATLSNFSKPYQLQMIRAAGFAVPETIITNDPEMVRAFNAHHGRIIYKSISSVRSIVRVLDADAIGQLDRIRALPTQFQQYIEGNNVRVHVVGKHVFATRIVSDAVDYRYAGRDGHEVDMVSFQLPDLIADRCRVLARNLGLPFCGIDLKQQSNGDYVCFEVNPSPAYSYYQEQTGQVISDSLVRFLAGHSD